MSSVSMFTGSCSNCGHRSKQYMKEMTIARELSRFSERPKPEDGETQYGRNVGAAT